MAETTQVSKFTGGVPLKPGEEGTTGQALIKNSNASGDYAWGDIPVPISNQIANGTSSVRVRADNGQVEVIVNGDVIATFQDVGTGLQVTHINGVEVNSQVINYPDPPAAAVDMLTNPNNETKYSWTPDEIVELITEVAGTGNSPTGMIAAFPTSTVPFGWLECNSQIVSQSGFPDLYSVIGNDYDEGTSQGISTAYETPSVNQRMLHGGAIGSDLIYVYYDVTSDEYRVRKTDLTNTTLDWETVLPGQVGYDPFDGSDVFDYDNAGNVYIRVSEVGTPGNKSLVKVDNTGSILIQTTPTTGAFHKFKVNKVTEEVSFCSEASDFLRKSNNGLVEVWNLNLPGSGVNANIVGIAVDEADGSSIAIQRENFITKVDSVGVQVWNVADPAPSGLSEGQIDIAVLPNQDIITCGKNGTTGVAGEHYISVHRASDGVFLQFRNSYVVQEIGVAIDEVFIRGIHVLSDGFIYAVEDYQDDTYLVKVDPSDLNTIVAYSRIYTPNVISSATNGDLLTFEPVNNGAILGGAGLGITVDKGAVISINYETFRVPESRGEFIRGWDNGRGEDSGRAIGTAQELQTDDTAPTYSTTNRAFMVCIKT